MSFVVNVAITAFCYLCVPLCLCLYCWGYEKKLSLKAIKRIVYINFAVIWLIFRVIAIEQGIEGSGAAGILWSVLAQWLLKKKCLEQ